MSEQFAHSYGASFNIRYFNAYGILSRYRSLDPDILDSQFHLDVFLKRSDLADLDSRFRLDLKLGYAWSDVDLL